MSVGSLFLILSSSAYFYRYFLLFGLVFIEGPITMVVSGFLIHLGVLKWWLTYLILITGDLAADVMWYLFGYYLGPKFVQRFGKFFSIDEVLVEKISHLYRKRGAYVLFFSKLTMGLGFSLVNLFASGLAKISLRKFLFYNFLGELIWVASLLTLGYSIANVSTMVDQTLRTVFLVASLCVLIAAFYGFSRYLRKRFPKIL